MKTFRHFRLVHDHQTVHVDLDDLRPPLLAERTVAEILPGDAGETKGVSTIPQHALIVGVVQANRTHDHGVFDSLLLRSN